MTHSHLNQLIGLQFPWLVSQPSSGFLPCNISVDVQDLFVKNDRLEGTGSEIYFVFLCLNISYNSGAKEAIHLSPLVFQSSHLFNSQWSLGTWQVCIFSCSVSPPTWLFESLKVHIFNPSIQYPMKTLWNLLWNQNKKHQKTVTSPWVPARSLALCPSKAKQSVKMVSLTTCEGNTRGLENTGNPSGNKRGQGA